VTEARQPAGYAAIAGAANSGKSSLFNSLVGSALSPVTEHPGTTRVPLTGVFSSASGQICLVDTPPLESGFDPDLLAWMDVICLLADARSIEKDVSSPPSVKLLRDSSDKPVILVLTHVDYFLSSLHRALASQASRYGHFAAVCPACGPSIEGVPHLRASILLQLPPRRRLFPDGCITLHSERFLISELVRTQLFNVLPVDIASTTAVQIEEFSIRDAKTYVRANLHVSRHSSKGMVIGRKGQTLQKIMESTSAGASALLGRSISLDLWVKVRESWPDNPHDLLEFGYAR
jgi:GTP-binding protein Era